MKYRNWKIVSLIIAATAGILGYFYLQFQPAAEINFGLTYSHRYAAQLGLDPKETFLDILNDLKPGKIRLMAYWEDIEPEPGVFDFHVVDELLIEAGKRQVDVVLVLGHKQPRWPECHHPYWYSQLSETDKEAALLNMVNIAGNHFKVFDSIKTWQIENEPFFAFGDDCSRVPSALVRKEMDIIRSIDPRPILLTDSGETGGFWVPVGRLNPDVFGATMYRIVYNPKIGFYKYPLPTAYYRVKAGILKVLTGQEAIIGAELQAEPWFLKPVHETDLSQQLSLMNPKVFLENIEYAKKVGFQDNYLWGVEWWYWLANKHNDWGMWDQAKQVITTQK